MDDGAGIGHERSTLDAEVEQFETEVRRIAAGGWRRAVLGFVLGAAAGALAALLLPREEGPARRVGPGDRPTPWLPDTTDD